MNHLPVREALSLFLLAASISPAHADPADAANAKIAPANPLAPANPWTAASPSAPANPTAPPTFAGTLTLDQCLAEGLQNSPDIQKSQAQVEESHWRKNEMIGAGFLPKVSINADHYVGVTKYALTDIVFFGQNFNFPGIFPSTQATLNASIPIFDGLANIYHAKSASLSEDASEQELDHTKFELAQQIRLVFFQALGAAALEDVANENVKTLDDHLKQVQIQLRGGTATNYDSLRVSVQLNEANSDAVDAHDNALLARQKLSVLLALPQDDRALQGELPAPDATRVQGLEQGNAATERSDLRALEMRAEAADKADTAQSAWLVPQISVGGQYTYYDDLLYSGQVIDNHNYQTAYNLGIFLTWNLFDGGVSYDRAQEAKAQRIQAEKTSESARIQVPYDFSYWKKRYLSSASRYLAKQLDVTRSQESVRLAKEEERAGTRTSTEALDAELDLFRSKAGVVNAQLNAIEAQIRLELALGRRI